MYYSIFAILFYSLNLLVASQTEFNSNTTNSHVYSYKLPQEIKKYRLTKKLDIKQIHADLFCGECCFPVINTKCKIFYNFCKIPILKNHQFLFSNKNINTGGQFASKIKNHFKNLHKPLETILIANSNTFFSSNSYNNLNSTLIENTNKLEKLYNSNDEQGDYFTEVKKKLTFFLKTGVEKKSLRGNLTILLTKLPVNSTIGLSLYNVMVDYIDTSKSIPISHPGLIKFCESAQKIITQPVSQVTTKKLAVPTTIYFRTHQAPYKKNVVYPDKKLIIIAVSTVATTLIISVITCIVCKKIQDKKNNTKGNLNSNLNDIKTFDKQYNSTNEHIYEDPCLMNVNIPSYPKYNNKLPCFVDLVENTNKEEFPKKDNQELETQENSENYVYDVLENTEHSEADQATQADNITYIQVLPPKENNS
jgi:hypothetical protein